MADLRIGPLSVEHAGEVLTLQRAAYVTEAQRYREPFIAPLTETVGALRADLASGVLALGAWLGPRLVGAVRGRVDEDGHRMEVARFVVAPDQQGCGIGTALLGALHAAAPPRVCTFWLVTGARSDDNLRFYTRAGYRVAGSGVDDAGVALMRLERPRAGVSVPGAGPTPH